MHQNLRFHRSTEVLTRFSNTARNFFVLQVGDESDSVSVDRLKPVISAAPVTLAVPPPCGWPRLVPGSIPKPLDPVRLLEKKLRFSVLVPATKLHWNPCLTVLGSLPLSAILWAPLLGE